MVGDGCVATEPDAYKWLKMIHLVCTSPQFLKKKKNGTSRCHYQRETPSFPAVAWEGKANDM